MWADCSLRHKYLKSDLNLNCSRGLVATGKVRSSVWRLPGSGVQNVLPSDDDTNMY